MQCQVVLVLFSLFASHNAKYSNSPYPASICSASEVLAIISTLETSFYMIYIQL